MSMPFGVPATGMTKPDTPVPPPVMSTMKGWTMSLTNDVTIAVNAAPMMMPTAMSITLPRLMNSLNSLMNFMIPTLARSF